MNYKAVSSSKLLQNIDRFIMNETTNASIEAWESNETMDLTESIDSLAMSAPAILKLPNPSISVTLSEVPEETTLNKPSHDPMESNQQNPIIHPTRPQTEKIMYASSPRNSKIMENIHLSDIDYLKAVKKYDIQLPNFDDEETQAVAAKAAADKSTSKDDKKKKKKEDKGKGKEKKKTKAQLQTELEEKWLSSKIDLLNHYTTCCNKLSITPDPLVVALLSKEPSKNETLAPLTTLRIDPNASMPEPSEEEQAKKKKSKKKAQNNNEGDQVVADQEDHRRPLGAGGTRALMSALAGGWVGGEGAKSPRKDAPKNDKGLNGQFVTEKRIEMKDSKKKKKVKVEAEGYNYLKVLSLRNGNIKTTGISSISSFLTRSQSKTLTTLILFNCNIESLGCQALGNALRFGNNTTLSKLSIDCDLSIGDIGVSHLCRGLETNPSITDLSVCSIGFKQEGAKCIASLLTAARSRIQLLAIRGNMIGEDGLISISNAMIRKDIKGNSTCKLAFLNVANVGVNGSNTTALTLFGKGVETCRTLRAINFDYNPIGKKGGQALIDGWNGISKSISHLNQFVVSSSLPANIFAQIHRSGGNGKKGKKKKKKKKNKKDKGGITVPEIVPDIHIALQWMVASIAKRQAAAEEENKGKK